MGESPSTGLGPHSGIVSECVGNEYFTSFYEEGFLNFSLKETDLLVLLLLVTAKMGNLTNY